MILHIPSVLPNSITKNALWQSSSEDEQILQGTCYSRSLKSCQMNVLPFMDLKWISDPQQHIAISWCAYDPINTAKKTLGKR